MSSSPDGSAKIQVNASETGPVTRRVQVEVPAARVKRAFERAYRELAHHVAIPGFRRGKAPRSVLEKRYGESLAEDIERALVSETLAEALEEAGIDPVSEPAIDAERPRMDADFRYAVDVEVKPAIELPDLAGLPAKRRPVEVGDAEVEHELEALRQRHAQLLEEPEGTAAAVDHVLSIDFVGRIDGEPFEGGTGRGVDLTIGSGRFLPGFEEQLTGARSGDDREVQVQFPDDYGDARLRGKPAVFQVHVAAVRRRQVPELDDEFAKDLGDFASLEALRARIRADLVEMRERESKDELRRSLVDALIERTAFEVPPGLVERHRDRRLERARRHLHGSVPEEALHAQLERWRESWREDAVREVRESLLLAAVADQEGLAASPEEIEARVAEIAAAEGVSPRQLRQSFGEEIEVGLRVQMVEEKAVEFLAARAKFDGTSGS